MQIKQSYQNWRLSTLILCLGTIASVAAPLKVTAQTDTGNGFVEGELDIVDLIENNPSPIENFFNDVFNTINPIIDRTKEVIAEINGGSLEDAILTTLGAVGLIDPQEEASSVSTSEQSPYSNPQSTEEVIESSQAADDHQSQIQERLSQIVFGHEGQEVIDEQNQAIAQTQTDSTQAQIATGAVYQTTKEIAIDNYQHADQIADQAAQAQAANASQDVLKALAAQNQYIAEINSGVSEQLALLGEAQVYNSVQMNGINEQLTIANQRQQNIETFLASSNSQLAEIDGNQELQIRQMVEKDNQEMLRSRQGITRVFIRGLFVEGAAQNNAPVENNNLDSLDVTTASGNDSFFKDLSAILNQ